MTAPPVALLPGVDFGRVAPRNATAEDGEYVLSLGTDRPGLEVRAAVGDYLGFTQNIDRTGTNRLAHVLMLRGPARMPLLSVQEPFALADGDDLTLRVDGDEVEATFDAVDFVDIGNATAYEVCLALAPQLPADYQVRLEPEGRLSVRAVGLEGKRGVVEVVGGSAAAALSLRKLSWQFSLRVGGAERARRYIRPGDDRRLEDVGAVLQLLPAVADYELRLELVDEDGVGDPGASAVVEVPGCYVDLLSFTQQSGMYLLNRDPEPGEVARAAWPWVVHVASGTGAVVLSSIMVTVTLNGAAQLAYDGGTGGFKAPYDGPASVITSISTNQIELVIDPNFDVPGDADVQIDVYAEGAAFVATVLEAGYSFTVEDLTPPQVVSASMVARDVVRVRFSESVRGDLVRAGDVSISTTDDVPAVGLEVVEVSPAGNSAVDVRVDIPASFRRRYGIFIAEVYDLNDNRTVDLEAEFIGYVPNFPANRRFVVTVPQINLDLSPDGTMESLVAIYQDVFEQVLCLIDEFVLILDTDRAPIRYVEARLRDLGNPFTFDMTDDQKRKLVRILVQIYQRKGTTLGMQEVVRFFTGIDVTIVPRASSGWILGDSVLGETTEITVGSEEDLFRFAAVSPVAVTDAERTAIDAIVRFMKPSQELYDGVVAPAAIPPVTSFWILGTSTLGVDTIL